jgi:hypothetical protein
MPMRVETLRRRLADPLWLVEIFAIANIAFLAVDILVAHAINAFAEPAEWVPLAFSPLAALALLAAMALGGATPRLPGAEAAGEVGRRQRLARRIGLAVGGACVVVGVAGLVLHLESQFFEQRTLRSLVYTAPFAAPLAYTGLGLLLILDRMVDARTLEWARWVLLLAMGGFLGNFVLSLADHAQNGFFEPAEWVAVVSAAFAVGALLAAAIFPGERPTRRLAWAVLALQAAVGMLGFVLHAWGNLSRPGSDVWAHFLYGAPAFAPLLYADLAALGGLGLWALARAEPTPTSGRVPTPTPAGGGVEAAHPPVSFSGPS